MSWDNLSMADRTAYIKLGLDNGIIDLGVIRSTYNKYAEGGETDSNSQLEEDYYAGTLPEIVVKPEEWQTDFIKNFANKEIRQSFYRTMASKANNLRMRKEKEVLRSLGYDKDLIDDYLESTSNEGLLREEEDIDNKLHRLYNVYNKAGRPKIVSKDFLSKLGARPHYIPILDRISANSPNAVISELSHPIQTKYDKDYSISNLVRDVPLTIVGELNRLEHYNNPSHYEYRTHKVIEPIVRDYIYNNDYRYNSLINGLDTSTGVVYNNANDNFLDWKNNKYATGGYTDTNEDNNVSPQYVPEGYVPYQGEISQAPTTSERIVNKAKDVGRAVAAFVPFLGTALDFYDDNMQQVPTGAIGDAGDVLSYGSGRLSRYADSIDPNQTKVITVGRGRNRHRTVVHRDMDKAINKGLSRIGAKAARGLGIVGMAIDTPNFVSDIENLKRALGFNYNAGLILK